MIPINPEAIGDPNATPVVYLGEEAGKVLGIRQRTHDQGPWHCAERGCPGGHMLPNASCAALSTDRPDQPEG